MSTGFDDFFEIFLRATGAGAKGNAPAAALASRSVA
jgi:hypothetical protein